MMHDLIIISGLINHMRLKYRCGVPSSQVDVLGRLGRLGRLTNLWSADLDSPQQTLKHWRHNYGYAR